MKTMIRGALLVSTLLTLRTVAPLAFGAPPDAAKHSAKAGSGASPAAHSLNLAGTTFLHRWSQADQHEFTPEGQEDLQRWRDMLTVNYYKNVKDGDALSATANSALENYKSHNALVVKTSSVPRTAERPAEYLIVVFFPQPDFIEAVFARFKLIGEIGAAAIYSHREYGQKIGDRMSAWLQQNGPAIEKALLSADGLPPAQNTMKLP